jgi:hypothetical protein
LYSLGFGAQGPLLRASTITVSAQSISKWIKLAQSYSGSAQISSVADRTYSSDSGTLAVSAPSCTQTVAFAEFFDGVLKDDFSVIIRLVNAPSGVLHVVSSATATTTDLALISSVSNSPTDTERTALFSEAWRYPNSSNHHGYSYRGRMKNGGYTHVAGSTTIGQYNTLFAAYLSPLAVSGSTDALQRFGIDGSGTVFYRVARTGSTLQVSVSTDGASWTTSPGGITGFTGCSLSAVTVPSTHGVLVGYGVYGEANASRPPFQMQVMMPFSFPTGGSVSAPRVVMGVPTTLTLSATGHDTANSSTCTLYSVAGKTYTLIGTGTMKTNGTATFVYSFASTGTYTFAFTIVAGSGIQSGYIPVSGSIVVNYMM